MKYVPYKDLKPAAADLKTVYQAPDEETAQFQLEVSAEKWDKKYPQTAKPWRDNWAEPPAFFKYPAGVRRMIYTTNAVEGFHRMLRKYTEIKTAYPSGDALKNA